MKPQAASFNRWNAQAVEHGIAPTRFAGKIHHLATVPSTSTVALEAAQSGAPEGQVWVADEQTAGRGRGGHTWHSAPTDGLYFSLLLRPTLPPDKALWLSLLTGLSVQSAILEVTGHKPDLRWPNDLLLVENRTEKKVGGILVETSLTPSESSPALLTTSRLRHAIIGIGINVAHRTMPPELELVATSLLRVAGVLYSREALLSAILRTVESSLTALDAELGQTLPPHTATLLDRFASASTWVRGKSVRVDESGGDYTGITAGLDDRGFLLVTSADGFLHTVLSGGVRSF